METGWAARMDPFGRNAALLLLPVFLFLYLWGLDGQELTDIDEGRSGVIVRDMADRGHWLLPRTTDGYLSEKPPVYYWMAAVASKAFGASEWTLRGVSVAMAIGTLALVAWLAGLYSVRAAAVAVVALGSNAMFTDLARSAGVDMTLTFFTMAGLAFYFAARLGKLRILPAAAGAGVAFGLATLSKGPLGLALPCVVLVGDLLVTTRGRFWAVRPPWGAIAMGAGLTVAVALAWYLPAYLRGGREFLETSILSENFYMPLGQPRGLGVAHRQGLLYYPGREANALLPLLPLLPETLRWIFSRDAGAGRAHLLTWVCFGLVLFSAASNKRYYYLLPLQPALALLPALAMARRLEEGTLTPALRWGAGATGAGLAAVSLGGVFLGLQPSLLERLPARTQQYLSGHLTGLVVFSMLAIGVGVLLIVASRGTVRRVVLAAFALAFLAVGLRSMYLDPAQRIYNHTRPFARSMRAEVPPGVRPAAVGFVMGYGLEFYWPEIVRDDGAFETGEWLLVHRDRLAGLKGRVSVLGVWDATEERTDVLFVHRTFE